ncbi:MAG: C25 family cysteine peptidase, partial [Bacteroidota bacterium]
DVEHIPYRGFYCYVQSGSGYSDNDIPADLYYSGLDGTWNDNGDNLWGEIGEDDLLPDVAVGRFSFSNQTELNAMLNKTTSYQDNPIPGEFTYPLLAGEHLWNSPLTWGSDYLNLLVGYHDDNGYTTIGIPPDHNIDSLYEKYQSWGGSDIIAEINTGKSFVHHCGHANSSNVMHLSTSDITNSNFSQVNGITHNFTFVFSHGCICGAFDNADCIMEHMVKIENFAAAVIGNSRYGWFNEGQTEGPAAHLHREMVDALYEEQMGRIGAAFVECKIQTAPWVNAPGQHEEGALRWNFYDINILGDPTLQLWTDEPFDVSAQFSSPILVGAASFDVSVTSSGSPVEGLSCTLTKDGIFHGTALSDSNGNATIIIDPLITTVGTAQLTISGYNCLTNTYNIAVSPASGPFIIYQDNTIDDTAGGNANGLVDYGESIEMTINLANAGTGDATNVEATLSTAGQYITITDDFGEYGTIAAGTAVAPVNEFSFDVDAYVPDQYVADFTLDITGDGKDNWSGGFSIILNAPVLEAGTLVIDDNASGNGNGFLDPGETAILSIGVLNTGHSDASETLSTLSTSSSWVTLNNTSSNLGTLEPGINANATFEVSVNANAPIGTLAEFSFNATAGEYSVSEDYASTIGVVVEDWESGGFTQFNWQFAADAPWTMCTDEPWEGDYCVRSGDISDDMQSELYVSLEVLADGDLSFYRKLSSEAEWDYLKFYIDYEFMGEWSGELDWEMVSFPVEAGLHTFRWIYEKDAYYSSGEDCAWIDYIVFPPVDITTGIPIQMSNTGVELSLWPNPTGHILNIDYRIINETEVNISLYDILGQKVLTLQENTFMPAGQYHLSNDVSQLESGIYLCRLQSSNGMLTRKIVIE